MLFLFLITIFSGAGLLFLVQPMIAKQLLPMLGGSPAVWNTCMVFFQLALLAGYVYAHLLSKIENRRTQIVIHAIVVFAALTTLPIGLGGAAGPTPGQSPNAWLLLHLTTSVGGPFFVLASASPLIQRWFGSTSHRWAADPYFLYAASNAGSMLALLGYPLWYEPSLTLSEQTQTWSFGFFGFAILALACFFVANRAKHSGSGTTATTGNSPPLDWVTRARWIALAFVPSSLMLGVTQHITTDVATTPILWVGPLAIYLLTFIIAFARLGRWIVAGARVLVPLAVLAVGILLVAGMRKPIWPQVWIHLSGLLILGIACHGRLAAERPHASRLTEFYLLLSVGGALGGAFNALLAPVLFDWIAEYPITLVLACLLRRPRADQSEGHQKRRWRPLVWGAVAIALVGALFAWRWEIRGMVDLPDRILGFPAAGLVAGSIPAIGCLVWYFHRLAFALGVLVLFAGPRIHSAEDLLFTERTFFGVHRVLRGVDPNGFGEWHHLWHGSTGHGSQFSAKPWSDNPTRYYTRSGPAGDLMRVVGATPGPKSVALIGLGVGTLAAYGKADWRLTYYEIDPAVIRVARDPELFTYCARSEAKLNFVVGDARLRLAATTDRYDALFLDAFSSDAIPVHLITKEAVELYLQRLNPNGILAFHITNLHLNLQPVLANIANDLGLLVAVRHDGDTEPYKTEWKEYSAWVVLARTRAQLGSIAPDQRWEWLAPDPKQRTWTDDYSNVLGVMK